MTHFTMPDNPRSKRRWRWIFPTAFWLIVWQAVSAWLGEQILLCSPAAVAKRLVQFLPEPEFWEALFFSLGRIGIGFLLAVAAGVLLAGLSAGFRVVKELVFPMMLAVKAVPVASFVILALVWVSSRNLSVLISFLMVLPVVYTSVLEGIESTDRKLLEMAEVFRIPALRRVRYLYVSQVMPFFRSACVVSLGLCWKAGVAAEVIGIPSGSIGEKLYEAKIYLETPDLFAWTLVIVLASLLFERMFGLIIDKAVRVLERM